VFERRILDEILKRLVRKGHVQVRYWDRTYGHYGDMHGATSTLKVEITDPRVVRKLLVNASLALGEGYVNGQVLIDEEQLPLLFELIARNQPATPLRQPFRRHRNRKEEQKSYIESHYDVGNDYYDLFLDPTRLYSCAYFVNKSDSLEMAQRQKIDHLLNKLQLKPGMRLLDIGCGWGHLAVAAAKKYGVKVLGITLSEEQLKGAQELAEREGVTDLVEFRGVNYLDLEGEQFDRIISVGMFEHVGKGNSNQYFSKVAELLVEGGISVLHTITQQFPMPTDAWVDKYIFPGGYLPTVAEIADGIANSGLYAVDYENLWRHYADTLLHWRHAHQRNRDRIIAKFGRKFYRIRDFWLAGSEGGFRYGRLGLIQVVITKGKPADGTWPTNRGYLYK
jgi:cyclopropane-fatty-acyl-phospholipid synthase